MIPYILQGPDGFPRPVDIEKKDNLYKIKYTPDDCGRYTIDALYDGKPLPQSPIHVQSYSTGNVSSFLHDRCKILTLNFLRLYNINELTIKIRVHYCLSHDVTIILYYSSTAH